VASLKPKLFCGVAIQVRSINFSASTRWNDRLITNPTATRTVYATIAVKRPILLVEQRLHTYRTNWTLPLRASDRMSETADYTGAWRLCQAQAG
jgi:hypothetical protein